MTVLPDKNNIPKRLLYQDVGRYLRQCELLSNKKHEKTKFVYKLQG